MACFVSVLTLLTFTLFRVRKIGRIVTPANLPFEDHQHWVSAGYFVDQKPLHHDKDQTGSLRYL